jgi:hypothetical protein
MDILLCGWDTKPVHHIRGMSLSATTQGVTRGPRRSNAPGLLDEIYLSICQRKVLTPGDFADLDEVEYRLLGFQRRYEQTAVPYAWRFTRADLDRLLDRLVGTNGR